MSEFPHAPSISEYRPDAIPLVSLSSYDITANRQPDGRLVTTQQLDQIRLGVLEENFHPDVRVPQEIAFTVGDSRHSVFSAEQLPTVQAKLREEAARRGLKVRTSVSSNGSSETAPWVHAEYGENGKLEGVEELSPELIKTFIITDGKTLDGRSPTRGQQAVSNLQAHWYEGALWARRSGGKQGQASPAESHVKTEPTDEIAVHPAAAAINGVGGMLSGLGDTIRRQREAWQAEATSQGVPVSALSTKRMSAIAKQIADGTYVPPTPK